MESFKKCLQNNLHEETDQFQLDDLKHAGREYVRDRLSLVGILSDLILFEGSHKIFDVARLDSNPSPRYKVLCKLFALTKLRCKDHAEAA